MPFVIKMLKDLLREVIVIVAGKQAEEISDILYSKKHVNEFLIAKKLEITINQTRNILYKISDHGLVSSIRKKDKRKGWYTYFWKIEVIKTLEFLRNILLKNIQQLEHQIKSRETKIFYICENCHVEYNEENALLRDFTCPECGRILVQKDNTRVLRELKKNLDQQKKKLVVTEEEVGGEREKEEKKRVKEIRKEEKRKVARRKRARKKSAKMRAKEVEKKVTKKKKSMKKSAKRKFKKKPKKKKPKRGRLVKRRPIKRIAKKIRQKRIRPKKKSKIKTKKRRR